jgi:hypothetical protein
MLFLESLVHSIQYHIAQQLDRATARSLLSKRKGVDRTNPDFERLKSHKVRLDTFYDWPSRATRCVYPKDLAVAGLFFTGIDDRVQCAYCRQFLHTWVQGEKPLDEHRKLFPDCSFLRLGDQVSLNFLLS